MNVLWYLLPFLLCPFITAKNIKKTYPTNELPEQSILLPTDSVAVQTFLKQTNLKCPNAVNIEKLSQASIDPSIVKRMQKPAEKKSWSFYKKLFITQKRIQDGKWFIRQNRRTLRHVQHDYNIPSTIITAIIGVETMYGQRMGNDRVLDSLSTLAFYYPRRAAFFQSELACYLNQSCDYPTDHINLKGSYAGAFGIAQFMPCSYQDYAFSPHTEKADIVHSSSDAITSIASYLKKKGKWQGGEKIATKLKAKEMITIPEGIKTDENITKLNADLCTTIEHCPKGATKIWCPDEECYWLYPNFDSIMTYNISRNYALAVTLLSQSLQS